MAARPVAKWVMFGAWTVGRGESTMGPIVPRVRGARVGHASPPSWADWHMKRGGRTGTIFGARRLAMKILLAIDGSERPITAVSVAKGSTLPPDSTSSC